MELTLPEHDYTGDGSTQTAKFVLSGDLRYTEMNRTGLLFEGGSSLAALFGDLAESLGEENDYGNNQKLAIDVGGGEHVIEVDAQVVEGSTNRWGTDDGTVWDKTGAAPYEQVQIFNRALQQTKIDSKSPATLSIGLYGSELESIDVIPEQPEGSFDSTQESSTATISVSLVELASLDLGDQDANRTG